MNVNSRKIIWLGSALWARRFGFAVLQWSFPACLIYRIVHWVFSIYPPHFAKASRGRPRRRWAFWSQSGPALNDLPYLFETAVGDRCKRAYFFNSFTTFCSSSNILQVNNYGSSGNAADYEYKQHYSLLKLTFWNLSHFIVRNKVWSKGKQRMKYVKLDYRRAG